MRASRRRLNPSRRWDRDAAWARSFPSWRGVGFERRSEPALRYNHTHLLVRAAAPDDDLLRRLSPRPAREQKLIVFTPAEPPGGKNQAAATRAGASGPPSVGFK